MSDLFAATYNPDVLSCLANLSNDEVFTPPDVVNQMLDMLPEEIWHDRNATFLDPACKSGVFLREIAKRLIEAQLPDYEQISYEINEKLRQGGELDGRDIAFQKMLEDVCEHVFKEQLFGIAITELTSLMSRRSVYCSKYPNCEYSVVRFDNPTGNIDYKQMEHTWKNGKCVYCGASEGEYDREEGKEQYAYEFIHLDNPSEVFDMKFDVIVGNPPYQMSDGGNKASAKPIYHQFVEQAKKLNPRYLTMIIPARWYTGGKGLDGFREQMLNDCHITKLVDYFDSTECFPGVDISGGICYFLWDRDKCSDCEITSYNHGEESVAIRPLINEESGMFIRFNEAVKIIAKVSSKNEPSFSQTISSRKPFGISTKPATFSKSARSLSDPIKIYSYPEDGYVSKSEITQNKDLVKKYKVAISYAYGERGEFPYLVIGKPFIIEPGAIGSETYIIIDAVDDENTAKNIESYMTTKLFRFLVLMKKNTQHATKSVYSLVPMQDFSKPWTDEELYKKYDITKEEQTFIDSLIRPMELGD